MSDTPRTDAELIDIGYPSSSYKPSTVPVEFARQLERELIASKNHNDSQKKLIDSCAREIIALRHELQTLKEQELYYGSKQSHCL